MTPEQEQSIERMAHTAIDYVKDTFDNPDDSVDGLELIQLEIEHELRKAKLAQQAAEDAAEAA